MSAAATTLASAITNGYDKLSTHDLLLCAVYGAANGSGGGTSFTSGNYGGSQPNFTPSGSTGLAVDTSNGRIWWYYSGAWN
jgi:hypothetical protein